MGGTRRRETPRMVVVAGPPGTGKSTAFPVSEMGLAFFNADDRAAQLNGGDYRTIPASIRERVGKDLEHFVEKQIQDGRGFAYETTLRTPITLEQARRAKAEGFKTFMLFLGVDDVEAAIARVATRVEAGGHPIAPDVLRTTYAASLRHLAEAFSVFDVVRVYDTSEFGKIRLVMVFRNGKAEAQTDKMPAWLTSVLDQDGGGEPWS